ncbi:MAG TPA: phosphate ABC transporter substrate-binding protein PstS [Ignavibacteria bacterium]|nr:phosphate ABC transporter substrate-binding protein PstS [Ignavibacteria bacterium]
MKKTTFFSLFILIGTMLVLSACSDKPSKPKTLKLNGAGATFPYVIYSKWFDVYHKKTGIEFNYQSIGSGGGVRQVIAGTVDFGASDAPMKDSELKQVKDKLGKEIIHIPTVMGAVVVAYNLKSVGNGLKLTPGILSDIYLGKIKKWNNSKIKSVNKDKKLPNEKITVVHRSDGSGTTNIFTDYLTKVSSNWKEKVGVGKSVDWPVGLGGKGNEGVAGLVKQLDGTIGYVELAYAVQNKLNYAILQNKAGYFVKASFNSVSAAAEGSLATLPYDLRVSITNADGKDSYPISGFTWLLVYNKMENKQKKEALVNFLNWALTKGETYAEGLYYAPLPEKVIELSKKKIALIK